MLPDRSAAPRCDEHHSEGRAGAAVGAGDPDHNVGKDLIHGVFDAAVSPVFPPAPRETPPASLHQSHHDPHRQSRAHHRRPPHRPGRRSRAGGARRRHRLAYRGSKGEAEQGVADAVAQGRRGVAIQADVSKAADCEALVSGTVTALGRIDVVVNMASVYGPEPFDTLTEAAGIATSPSTSSRRSCAGRRRRARCVRAARAAASSTSPTGWPAAAGRTIRFRGLLRRQGRRHRAHRGAGAGAGVGEHPRERDCAGPILAPPT